VPETGLFLNQPHYGEWNRRVDEGQTPRGVGPEGGYQRVDLQEHDVVEDAADGDVAVGDVAVGDVKDARRGRVTAFREDFIVRHIGSTEAAYLAAKEGRASSPVPPNASSAPDKDAEAAPVSDKDAGAAPAPQDVDNDKGNRSFLSWCDMMDRVRWDYYKVKADGGVSRDTNGHARGRAPQG